MGGSVYTPVLGDWGWFSDSHAEPVGGDALNSENTTPTLADNSSKIRLRVEIVETGGKASSDAAFYLTYSTDESSWNSLGAAAHWNYADGLGTEGDNVSSYLVADGGSEYGEYHESAINTDKVASGAVHECDFCIVPTANVSSATTYYFRVYAANTLTEPNATYGPNTHPSVTTAASTTAITQSGAGSITIAGYNANVNAETTFTVNNVGSITITGFSAPMSVNTTFTVSNVGALTISGNNPNLNVGTGISVGNVGSLVISGLNPVISIGSGYPNNFLAVSSANIDNVDGVATGDIGKVIGVS